MSATVITGDNAALAAALGLSVVTATEQVALVTAVAAQGPAGPRGIAASTSFAACILGPLPLDGAPILFQVVDGDLSITRGRAKVLTRFAAAQVFQAYLVPEGTLAPQLIGSVTFDAGGFEGQVLISPTDFADGDAMLIPSPQLPDAAASNLTMVFS